MPLSRANCRIPDRTHVAADERYRLTRTLSVAGGGFPLGLCALMALYITRSVSAPLTTMAAAMRRLIDGDLEVQVSVGIRNDEIGTMTSPSGVQGQPGRCRQAARPTGY